MNCIFVDYKPRRHVLFHFHSGRYMRLYFSSICFIKEGISRTALSISESFEYFLECGSKVTTWSQCSCTSLSRTGRVCSHVKKHLMMLGVLSALLCVSLKGVHSIFRSRGCIPYQVRRSHSLLQNVCGRVCLSLELFFLSAFVLGTIAN